MMKRSLTSLGLRMRVKKEVIEGMIYDMNNAMTCLIGYSELVIDAKSESEKQDIVSGLYRAKMRVKKSYEELMKVVEYMAMESSE